MITVKQNAHDKVVHVLDVAKRALFVRAYNLYKTVPRSIAPGDDVAQW